MKKVVIVVTVTGPDGMNSFDAKNIIDMALTRHLHGSSVGSVLSKCTFHSEAQLSTYERLQEATLAIQSIDGKGWLRQLYDHSGAITQAFIAGEIDLDEFKDLISDLNEQERHLKQENG